MIIIFSLIKASMTAGMNLFKISTKKNSTFVKMFLPIAITLLLMGSIYGYADFIMQGLVEINMGYVILSLFVILTSVITLIEGVYK